MCTGTTLPVLRFVFDPPCHTRPHTSYRYLAQAVDKYSHLNLMLKAKSKVPYALYNNSDRRFLCDFRETMVE